MHQKKEHDSSAKQFAESVSVRDTNWFVWGLHFLIGAFLGALTGVVMSTMGRKSSFGPDHWETCIACRIRRYISLHPLLGEPDVVLFCIGFTLIGASIVCLLGNRLWFGAGNVALNLAQENGDLSRRVSIGVGVIGVLVLAYAAIFT